MRQLPGWLDEARETVPQWIGKIRHPDGPGRYRFATDAYEPHDLDSSCMVHNVRMTVDGGLPEDERAAWAEYLCGLQEPTNGWLIDTGMERHICSTQPDGKILMPVADERRHQIMRDFICRTRTEVRRPDAADYVLVQTSQARPEEVRVVRGWTSRNGLVTILELGGLPRYKLAQSKCPELSAAADESRPILGPSGILDSAEEAVAYLSRLDWEHPSSWGAGTWAGTMLWYHRLNQLLGDDSAAEVIQAGVKWFLAKQDPATGAWSNLDIVNLSAAVNTIFKIWIQAIPAANLPVQYPEKVIDLCLRALREDPVLSGSPDMCSMFDVALVLDTALRFCDYRREEVAEVAYGALSLMEPLYRDDGAFSFDPEGALHNHGGLHLAPVALQSDACGTALACNALSLLCNLCGLRSQLGWTPPTETRMGLADDTAVGHAVAV